MWYQTECQNSQSPNLYLASYFFMLSLLFFFSCLSYFCYLPFQFDTFQCLGFFFRILSPNVCFNVVAISLLSTQAFILICNFLQPLILPKNNFLYNLCFHLL